MTDPGHPFSQPYETLIDALEESIHLGVEQPAVDRFVFQSSITAYELRWPAHAISSVSGFLGNVLTLFQAGLHYRFSNNRIIWIHDTEKPADGSRFEVAYTYRERPSGLTDFNPGSVVGTLIRAVARELKLVYEQIDQAYRRAFIDHAEGVALDNVVALLGLERNPALPAQGQVTFFRKKAPPAGQLFVIPVNTRVADESGRTYVTTVEGAITADSLDANNLYSVTVPVVAVTPGPEGNVNAETITIMPTPPTGVEGVINYLPVGGGLPAEADNQLRERARFHLERLGNATLNAIKFAVLDVDGVEGVTVADHRLNSAIPLGEVHVSYAGGDPAQVQQVVENTRAAGVLPVFSEIGEVLVAGTIYVMPDEVVPVTAVADFKTAVIAFLEALEIGQPLVIRKLTALVYDVGGLADVAEIQLEHEGASIPDPFLIKPTELIRPDETNLVVALLTSLHVTDTRRVGNTNEIDLQVLTESGPATFQDFSLDLMVRVHARLQTAPDQLPSLIGSFAGQVTFTGSDTTTWAIADAAVPGYDSTKHDPHLEITMTAVVYPGLPGTATTIDLGP